MTSSDFPTASERDREAIRSLIEKTYPELANAGDAEGYGELYTSDARWFPPHVPDRRGPAEIRFAFTAKNADIDARMHVDDLDVLGDIAHVSALARVLIRQRHTNATWEDSYRGFWLLRRQSGVWKIHRQIWTPKPEAEVRQVLGDSTSSLAAAHRRCATGDAPGAQDTPARTTNVLSIG